MASKLSGQRFEFATPPASGTAVFWGEQRFVVTQTRPHTRPDGAASGVITWRTECLDCGAPFEQDTGIRDALRRRRCSAHRRLVFGQKKRAET